MEDATAPLRNKSRRLVYIVTAPTSANVLLRGQLRYFSETGYDVDVICAPGDELRELESREAVTVWPVPIHREIAPLSDLVSVIRIRRVLRCLRPDIVNVGTPKAGLLGGIAAWSLRIPARVYILRGLRLETTTGVKRFILTVAERIACACAHTVICVSPSMSDSVLTHHLVSSDKTRVIGEGSSNGVDAGRISNSTAIEQAVELREKLGLDDSPVVGFVGRMTRDKGMVDLIEAIGILQNKLEAMKVLLVGDYESGDPLPQETRDSIDKDTNIVRTGFVNDIAPYYHIMDVLCLPTHREGFPNAPLEAACASVPTVTTDATGSRDAVIDGTTGLVVPVADPVALANAIHQLLTQPAKAATMGRAARERVEKRFSPTTIWSGLAAIYDELTSGRVARQ